MKRIDLQDVLLLAGIVSIVGGVAVWSRPAASVLFGLLCLFAVWQIERGKRVGKGLNGPAKP